MNDAVRRIMAEVKEMRNMAASGDDLLFVAAPLDSDLFEWHFSVRGPPDTAFEGGVYHGRILLPAEYPLKAPEIVLLTPNGRFELNTPICLSVTAHHQETWQPSWGIRTILTALIGFMPSPAEGLGALDFPDSERRKLAIKSHDYVCPRCGARPTEQLPPLKSKTPPQPQPSVLSSENEDNSNEKEGSGNSETDIQPSPLTETHTATPVNEAAPGAVDAAPAEAPVPAAAAVPGTPETRARGGVVQTRRGPNREPNAGAQEKGLLYATYGILAAIFAILLRRVL